SSASSATTGTPPIAARSLAFTANARRPSAAGVVQPRRKWTSSTSVSVVRSSGRRPGCTTAASSPGPTATRPPLGRRASRAVSWSSQRCSPTSRRRRTAPPLPEHRLHLLEKGLRQRVHLLAREAGELLEQLALTGGELAGRLDEDPDDLVTAPVPVELGNAAALQTERLSRLRAGGYLHLRRAVERGHVDLRAERRLREAQRDVAHDVGPRALEERMLLDVEDDVEVARRAGVQPGLALAPQFQA